MSLTNLEFAKEGIVSEQHLSYRGSQVYSDWEDEDDDEDAGWSYRSYVEEEEDEERPAPILEMKAA
jgi:hypothetical protein